MFSLPSSLCSKINLRYVICICFGDDGDDDDGNTHHYSNISTSFENCCDYVHTHICYMQFYSQKFIQKESVTSSASRNRRRPVADPGFPVGGGVDLVGGGVDSRGGYVLKIFVCQNERIGTLRGGARRARPP